VRFGGRPRCRWSWNMRAWMAASRPPFCAIGMKMLRDQDVIRRRSRI
jgi:hypothetical protein